MGATASPVVAMVAHFITRSATGGGPVHAGAMAKPGWKLDGGGLGASAVGNAWWMLFILQPAWQRIDSRLILIAQTLGWSQSKIFFYVKSPLMLRPTLIAFRGGIFSQYCTVYADAVAGRGAFSDAHH